MLYGLEELPRPSQMEQLCEKWRPYRLIRAWYMWRLIEGNRTPTTAAIVMKGDHVQPLQQIEPQQEVQQYQLQLLKSINGVGNLGILQKYHALPIAEYNRRLETDSLSHMTIVSKVQKSLADLDVLHSIGSGANLFIPTAMGQNS
ncbi:hypothetical protein BC332_25781 [Capsicum chinense]|nr:hypothetical protein BC332_25781 [Capsicum chinense]